MQTDAATFVDTARALDLTLDEEVISKMCEWAKAIDCQQVGLASQAARMARGKSVSASGASAQSVKQCPGVAKRLWLTAVAEQSVSRTFWGSLCIAQQDRSLRA